MCPILNLYRNRTRVPGKFISPYLFRSREAKRAESESSLSTRSLTSCRNVRHLSLDQNKGCLSTADAVGRNDGSDPIIFSIKCKSFFVHYFDINLSNNKGFGAMKYTRSLLLILLVNWR